MLILNIYQKIKFLFKLKEKILNSFLINISNQPIKKIIPFEK
jgi:hypothetical protein